MRGIYMKKLILTVLIGCFTLSTYTDAEKALPRAFAGIEAQKADQKPKDKNEPKIEGTKSNENEDASIYDDFFDGIYRWVKRKINPLWNRKLIRYSLIGGFVALIAIPI